MTGQELKELREKLRLKQSELGVLLGCTRFTVGNWERGKEPIPKIAELAVLYLQANPLQSFE